MTLLHGIRTLLAAWPFVAIFSTSLAVHLAFAASASAQFWQSSSAFHCNLDHSASHHSGLDEEDRFVAAVDAVDVAGGAEVVVVGDVVDDAAAVDDAAVDDDVAEEPPVEDAADAVVADLALDHVAAAGAVGDRSNLAHDSLAARIAYVEGGCCWVLLQNLEDRHASFAAAAGALVLVEQKGPDESGSAVELETFAFCCNGFTDFRLFV
mmetsp:Transcript_2442/g.4586  ORF Transcript_2442/g.4586 Transcript_2442/m.4586 type:complete len:209 (-) Transcript_2442:7-633(-)